MSVTPSDLSVRLLSPASGASISEQLAASDRRQSSSSDHTDNSNTTFNLSAKIKEGEECRKRNVFMGLSFSATATLQYIFGAGPILDAFLFIIVKGSNALVGLTESANGITALVVALPTAFIVDNFDRGNVCCAAGVISLVAMSITLVGYFYESFRLIMASFVVWGVSFELSYSASACIFQDSVSRRERTDYMTKRAVIECVCSAFGPFIQMLYFALIDDSWSLERCKWVLIVGLLVWSPIAAINLFFFKDPRQYAKYRSGQDTLSEASSPQSRPATPEEATVTSEVWTGIPTATTEAPTSTATTLNDESDVLEGGEVTEEVVWGFEEMNDEGDANLSSSHEASLPFGEGERGRPIEGVTVVNNANGMREVDASAAVNECSTGEFGSKEDADAYAKLSEIKKWAPLLILCTDAFRGIGSGMSVRFFTLFFINDYNFTPVESSALSMLYLVAIAALTLQANSLSKRIGRAEASLLFQGIGIALLLVLVRVRSTAVVVVVFVLRGAFANGCSTIDRAMVSDYTKSTQRGKYNAIETINGVTWCGSAVLGGIISDQKDYRYSFTVTAVIYAIGMLLYLPVLFLLPRDKVHADPSAARVQNGIEANEADTQPSPFSSLPQSSLGDELAESMVSSDDEETWIDIRRGLLSLASPYSSPHQSPSQPHEGQAHISPVLSLH
eukprot:GHVN01066016.1.p1 GENE.GHVN01066016.1~~GHVN01066016.1.p1  ORF type:complete len:674 (-),score=114.13 GHVN01066016.1:4964-6985(-)